MQHAMVHRNTTLSRTRDPAPSLDKVPASAVNVRSEERIVSALTGGVLLALGLARRSSVGKLAALLGSGLVYRGVTGHCHVYRALGVSSEASQTRALAAAHAHPQHLDLFRSATVRKSVEEVYRAWTQPETISLALGHFASIVALADGQLRWTVHGPGGIEHSWLTERPEGKDNESLRWVSAAGSPFAKTLTLRLHQAPGDRGTEMTLQLRMSRPGGPLGRVLSKLLGPVPAHVLERALGNVKSLLEAGELPSLKNNPTAR